jgi:carbon storage regulator CsrA
MLVLTRLAGETLVLIEDGRQLATITVARVDRGKVRLGVTAERSVEVWRSEVLGKLEAGHGDGEGPAD